MRILRSGSVPPPNTTGELRACGRPLLGTSPAALQPATSPRCLSPGPLPRLWRTARLNRWPEGRQRPPCPARPGPVSRTVVGAAARPAWNASGLVAAGRGREGRGSKRRGETRRGGKEGRGKKYQGEAEAEGRLIWFPRWAQSSVLQAGPGATGSQEVGGHRPAGEHAPSCVTTRGFFQLSLSQLSTTRPSRNSVDRKREPSRASRGRTAKEGGSSDVESDGPKRRARATGHSDQIQADCVAVRAIVARPDRVAPRSCPPALQLVRESSEK
ncbi:hypothetical protein CDD83_6189 [Cordyceps sp. RAO-2017]|nr:hypothetical protein CDD83_6189 [Cordyceps sp. RAO-2017]